MPIIKSAIKRAKQSEVRRLRNLTAKTAIKKNMKAVLDDASAKDVNAKLSVAYSKIDKAVKTGLIHKNTAARRKARLALAVNAAAKPVKPAAAKAPAKKPASKKAE